MDCVQTTAFATGLAELLTLTEQARVGIMRAEALLWRCRPALIADALVVCGVRVVDLLSRTSAGEHHLSSFAQVKGAHLVYPALEDAPGDERLKRPSRSVKGAVVRPDNCRRSARSAWGYVGQRQPRPCRSAAREGEATWHRHPG